MAVIRGSRNSISRDARKAFKIEGIKDIQKNVNGILNRVNAKRVKQIYYEAGVILRDQARANAPRDDKRRKGTHLKDAIFVDEGTPSKPDVLVGVRYKTPGGAPHAHLVEYGTSRSPAHPYFRPAIAQVGAQVAKHIVDGLTDLLEDQF